MIAETINLVGEFISLPTNNDKWYEEYKKG